MSLFSVENFANLGRPEVANPLAIAPTLGLLQLAIVALPVCILAAPVSIGVGYRRARVWPRDCATRFALDAVSAVLTDTARRAVRRATARVWIRGRPS